MRRCDADGELPSATARDHGPFELAGVDIVVDEDVQASVTQYLRNVPWDLALDHIARKYQLRVVRDDHVVRIANATR